MDRATNKPTVLDLLCPRCSSVIQARDTHCANCGAEIATSNDPIQLSGNQDDTVGPDPLVDNRWFVLGLLFLALAGFGLPLLWKSSAFSPLGKIVLTIIVLLYTLLLIWLIVVGLQQIFAQIQQLREAFR